MSSNTDNIDVTVANDSPVEQHTESGEPGEDLLPGHAESENDSTVGHDADSAVGEDNADSTASITSSILRYRTIRGRTFHSERGDAFYWGSNDDAQSEAMDVRALDIGCGTGMWAIDFADEFPSCKVVGTDISPIQPGFVPPNLVL
ncbi:hypothetical protein MRS44_012920 [Fusarium solani]|uniref:uncharacterized protein n=1 Tax=Fusarium solani TaxID=169388 RepID=UPI0032C4A434|nr:hypothetical protein MRS44_012920 [Fusarium solani]